MVPNGRVRVGAAARLSAAKYPTELVAHVRPRKAVLNQYFFNPSGIRENTTKIVQFIAKNSGIWYLVCFRRFGIEKIHVFQR